MPNLSAQMAYATLQVEGFRPKRSKKADGRGRTEIQEKRTLALLGYCQFFLDMMMPPNPRLDSEESIRRD